MPPGGASARLGHAAGVTSDPVKPLPRKALTGLIGFLLALTLGFHLMFLALRENSHAAAIIAVEAGQRVVTSGPYRLVRHPMYTGAVLAFPATPVALGSLCALLPAVARPVVIVVRLLDEERYLAEHLAGYTTYCETVRLRLLPGLW